MLRLAEAMSRHEAARVRLESLREEQHEALQRLRGLYGEGLLRINVIAGERSYLLWLHEQLQQAVEALQEAEAEVAAARDELIEAARAKQVMERLRDRHFEEYVRESRRQEQKFLDEVGVRLSIQPTAEEQDMTA